MGPEIRVYTTKICPYCVRAKLVLQRNSLPFSEIDVSDPEKRDWLISTSGRKTVPQIYIGEFHVGGSDELVELERSGRLFELTGTNPPR